MSLPLKNRPDYALHRAAACRRSTAVDCARCSAVDQLHSLADCDSPWSRRWPISSGTPPTEIRADHSLRRGAACCARFSVPDQRRSLANTSPQLAMAYAVPYLRLPPQQFSQKIPRFPAIPNRNWLANRSYRKHTTKPCLTETRIAHVASRTVPQDTHYDAPESLNIDAKMHCQGAPHAAPKQARATETSIPRAAFHTIEAAGVKVFYREAGPKDAPDEIAAAMHNLLARAVS